jgi:predicted aldo/keto reductase-like oxidoreductase
MMNDDKQSSDSKQSDFLRLSFIAPHSSFSVPVCRLGLATRGDNGLHADDVLYALKRCVNFLNWCGQRDALSETVAALGSRRKDVLVCVQFEARSAADARAELARVLRELGTDYVDAITFYYVEEEAEWQQITVAGGALDFCKAAQRDGAIRWLGVTTHQRPLAAAMARSRLLDFLMIRYNAAHRGAEKEVFPVTDSLGMPVVVYTCLRWGALLRSTPDDQPGFVPPPAPAWYRFALQSRSVTVALMAPGNRAELAEDFTVLDIPSRLSPEEYEVLAAHGMRVRRHAGRFP